MWICERCGRPIFEDENGCVYCPEENKPTDYSLTPEKKSRIDAMTHYEMAYMWRFTKAGEEELLLGDTGNYFVKRFNELGGWNSTLSKQIGWDRN